MTSPPPRPPRSHPPIATYRLQLRDGLTLDDVRERWLDPLADLGVSHLYLSPVFTAAAASTHGYDVVDPNVVDPVLSATGADGDAAFVALSQAAAERGLRIMIDLVPNHAATDHDRNARWWDLLRNGPASADAGWFDLDWDVPERRLRGRLLLPVLGDHYGRELEQSAFSLAIEDVHGMPEVVLVHPSTTTPLELGSIAPLLRASGSMPLEGLAAEIEALPRWSLPHDPDELAARRRVEPGLRRQVGAALADPDVATALTVTLDRVSANVDALDTLIEAQPYRLARWQTSLEDLSYRRFFDINSLIGVRVDRPDVFDRSHEAVRRWVGAGLVDGLRVDHVDGLRDPAGYLERLRTLAPDAWIVVEKILEGDESLPAWPVDGTTGYEAGDAIARLELDDEGRPALERVAGTLAGAPIDVAATVLAAKQDALTGLLSADVNRLTESLLRVCEGRRRVRDVTRRELHDVLSALLTRLDVYRTYVRPGHDTSAADRAVLDETLARVAEALPDADPEILTLLGSLLPGGSSDDPVEGSGEWDFVLRFQQLSGPAMAKGAEDTAWFRLLTLQARCEVGADPDDWGLALDRFHDLMARRQEQWPLAMTATSTHDSKRSEDVRVRLALLTQDADRWADLAEEWLGLVADTAPDPASSYRLLQSQVGAWPVSAARLGEFALKAEREAKERTSWLRPDEAFETALAEHVAAVGAPGPALDLVEAWVTSHDDEWRVAVAAHKLLALTVPGVPDLYQGSEDVLVRLTDPDNRHAVDPPGSADADSPKRALVRSALAVRAAHPDAFGPAGTYEPLWASGPRSDHAVAFTRGGTDGPEVVVVAPRRVLALADGGWRGTTLTLPDGRWRNALTAGGQEWEGTVDLDDLVPFDVADTPAALLTR